MPWPSILCGCTAVVNVCYSGKEKGDGPLATIPFWLFAPLNPLPFFLLVVGVVSCLIPTSSNKSTDLPTILWSPAPHYTTAHAWPASTEQATGIQGEED